MKTLISIIICAITVCFTNTTRAQQVTEYKVHQLKVKSTALITMGTVFTAAAIPPLVIGAIGIKRRDEYGTGNKINTKSNGPDNAIIMFSGGLAGFCAGAILLTVGLSTRKEFKLKEKQLSVGYLDSGRLGMALQF